ENLPAAGRRELDPARLKALEIAARHVRRERGSVAVEATAGYAQLRPRGPRPEHFVVAGVDPQIRPRPDLAVRAAMPGLREGGGDEQRAMWPPGRGERHVARSSPAGDDRAAPYRAIRSPRRRRGASNVYTAIHPARRAGSAAGSDWRMAAGWREPASCSSCGGNRRIMAQD